MALPNSAMLLDVPNYVDVKFYGVGLLAPAPKDPTKANVRTALENLLAICDRRQCGEFFAPGRFKLLSKVDTSDWARFNWNCPGTGVEDFYIWDVWTYILVVCT